MVGDLMITAHKIVRVLILGIVAAGCLKTEGTLETAGKVVDDVTGEPVPGRKVVVEALLGTTEKPEAVDAGHFTTDSAGHFRFLLRKVKNAYFYNFRLVGD